MSSAPRQSYYVLYAASVLTLGYATHPLRVRPTLAVSCSMFHARVPNPFRVATEKLLVWTVGLEPTTLWRYQLRYAQTEKID